MAAHASNPSKPFRWSQLSLRLRIMLALVGIPLVVMMPIFLIIGGEYRASYREAFWSKADLIARQLELTIDRVSPYVESIEDAPGLAAILSDSASRVPEFEFIALVDEHGTVLFHSETGMQGASIPQLANLEAGEPSSPLPRRGTRPVICLLLPAACPLPDGVVKRSFPLGEHYLVFRSIPMPGNPSRWLYIVVGEPANVVDPPLWTMLPALAGALGSLVLALVIPWVMNRLIMKPLRQLTKGAELLGAGELDYEIPVAGTVQLSAGQGLSAEFAVVASAFNDMARRLRELVSSLEHRVEERTQDLQRKTRRLQAASIVSKEAARVRNVPTLLETTVSAVSENFGFYHAGLFLLDEIKQWAVLQAASSEGGQRMVQRGHRLRVGSQGIVGFVAGSGLPRTALNVGDDAVWFNNPDLPETRSEMAVPLKLEGEVLGVLDVQSRDIEAFTEEDIETLQLMADQVAVALANARLLEQTQGALDELEKLQEDYTRHGWARVSSRVGPQAYEYNRVDVSAVPPYPIPPDLRQGRRSHKIFMDGGAPVMMEPMRVKEQIIGYVGLSDPQRIWTDEEISLVETVSDQVGLALENARLFEDAQRTARQQALLNKVLQVAATPGEEPEKILENIIDVLARGLGMAVGLFTFLDAESPELHVHAVTAPDAEYAVEEPGVADAADTRSSHKPYFARNFKVGPEQHVFLRGLTQPELGRMFELVPSEIEGAAQAISEFEHTYEMSRVLYVPISASRAQNGFLIIIQRRDEPPFDPETRTLALNLASQLAVVMDNLSLAEETLQRSEELQALYQVSLTLGEQLEPSEVLQMIVELGTSLLKGDAGAFYLYDGDNDELALTLDFQGGAAGRIGQRLKPGEGLSGWALREQRPLFVDDYAAWEGQLADFSGLSESGGFSESGGLLEPAASRDALGTDAPSAASPGREQGGTGFREAARSEGVRSAIAIPLIGRFGPLGVLHVSSRKRRAFGEGGTRLAELFAARAVAALENARLYQDTMRSAEELRYLYEAGLDMASLLNVQEILDRTAEWALRIFESPQTVVMFEDRTSGQFLMGQTIASQERRSGWGKAAKPRPGGKTHQVLQTGESFLVRDNRKDPNARTSLIEAGLLTQMGVPLRLGQEVLGVIFVNGTEAGQYDEHDLQLLEFLGTQVAASLENARLYQETMRSAEQLRALYEAGLELATKLDTREILDGAAEWSLRIFDSPQTVVMLQDRATGKFLMGQNVASRELTSGWGEAAQPRPGGKTYQVLESGESFLIRDNREDPTVRHSLIEAGLLSQMGVPLRLGEDVRGVMFVNGTEPGQFDPRDVQLLEFLASQVVTALENARLYQETVQSTEELRALYEAGLDLAAVVGVQETLDRAAELAMRVFDSPETTLVARNPATDEYFMGHSIISDERISGWGSGWEGAPRPGGMTDRIMQTGKSYLIKDNREHAASRQSLIDAGLLSQISVPLRWGQDILGAIFVNGATVAQYDEHDLELLQFLGTQIAAAAQSAFRFEETQSALSVVARQARYQSNVSQAVALMAERGTEAIDEALRLLGEAAEAERALYFEAYTGEAGATWQAEAVWEGQELEEGFTPPHRHQVGDGEGWPIANLPYWREQLERKGFLALKSTDLPAPERACLQERLFGASDSARAVLALAVRTGVEAYPGFVLFDRQEDLWLEEEIAALQTAAAALSSTIARDQLFDQVQHALDETESLYRASTALNTAQSYDGILDVLLRYTVLGQRPLSAAVALFNKPWSGYRQPDWSELLVHRYSGPAKDAESALLKQQDRIPLSAFVATEKLLRSEQPTLIEDLPGWLGQQLGETNLDNWLQRVNGGEGHLFAEMLRAGVRSALFVPMVVGGQWIGYLHAFYPESKIFPEAEIRRLMTLAQQAAVVVQNTYQLQATEARARREQMIREISSKIQSAPDVQGVLQTAVRELGRALGTPKNIIRLQLPDFSSPDQSQGGPAGKPAPDQEPPARDAEAAASWKPEVGTSQSGVDNPGPTVDTGTVQQPERSQTDSQGPPKPSGGTAAGADDGVQGLSERLSEDSGSEDV